MTNWYPQDKQELNSLLDSYLKNKDKPIKKDINGLIVPHAGYEYSGAIAGKAYSLLANSKIKRAIVLSPSHYFPLRGLVTHNKPKWQTPLGEIKISNSPSIPKKDISEEHAIDNQIPFLQKLGFKEIMPIVVGEISLEEAEKIAHQLAKEQAIFIFSSDLSHFLEYGKAKNKDKQTIQAILDLDENYLENQENSACGIFPLLIFTKLAKIKGWKPKLIEYKNSGDITGDKESVVGYASFCF